MNDAQISEEVVRDIARLARLSPNAKEVQAHQRHLDAILGHVRELEALDLQGVEPTSHIHVADSAFRSDTVCEGLTRTEALSAAPDAVGEGFGVPQVLEGDS